MSGCHSLQSGPRQANPFVVDEPDSMVFGAGRAVTPTRSARARQTSKRMSRQACGRPPPAGVGEYRRSDRWLQARGVVGWRRRAEVDEDTQGGRWRMDADQSERCARGWARLLLGEPTPGRAYSWTSLLLDEAPASLQGCARERHSK